jgi:hypothetical protein
MSHFNEASRYSTNSPWLQDTHPEHPHVESKGTVYQQHQNINANDVVAESNIVPTTALSTRSFSGSNFIDFEIPKTIHILKSATLALQIVNNDSTNFLRMPPIFNLISRFEIYIGSTLCQSVLSEDLYINYCSSMNFDRRSIMAPVTNVSRFSYDADSSHIIQPNESKDFYIRLYSLLSQCHIFLPGIQQQDIRIRIHFNSYQKWGIEAEDGYVKPFIEPVLQSCNIFVQHTILKDSSYLKLMNMYKNNTVALKFTDNRFQSVSLPVTAGVSVNHVLSSLNGLISHLYIFLRKQNAKGVELNEYIPIESLYLTNSSGANLHNGIVYRDSYLRSVYVNDNFEASSFFSVKPVYGITWSQDVNATNNVAVNLGCKHFSSQEQIYLKSSETNSAVELMVLAAAHSQLVINNGNVSVHKT